MVNGFVMKPKTTERGETMNRPTKKTTMRKHTREQMLALLHDDEAIKDLLQTTIQTVLEAEMDEVLGTGKGERNDARRGYPQRALPASAHDAGRHVGVAGAAGPRRVVFNRIVCPVSAQRKGAAFGDGGDVCAGLLHPQGAFGHRGAVRTQLQREHGVGGD